MKLISNFTLSILMLLLLSFNTQARDDDGDNHTTVKDLKFTPADIIYLADSLLELSGSKTEIFETNFDYLIKTYIDKNNAYFDPVFIHLVNQYIKTDIVDWLEPSEKEFLINRSNQLWQLQAGQQPPNLLLMDENSSAQFLLQKLDTNASTILLFWDIDCKTCTETANSLNDLVDELETSIQPNIYTVSASENNGEWSSKISEFPYSNWYHFVDPTNNRDGFQKYLIEATPTFFVLDKQGKIRGKFHSTNNKEKLLKALDCNSLKEYTKSIATDDEWFITVLIKKLHKHYKIKKEIEAGH